MKRISKKEKRELDILGAIKGRRSIRFFTKQPVSEEEIKTLIDAARQAPSAGNVQPWEFVIVRKAEVKHEVAVAAGDQTFVEEAPVVIVVCANEDSVERAYGSRGVTLYCLQDTAAATQNILLAAYSLGLGTCWVGAFEEAEVSEALKIPEGVRPVAIIPVGHATANPPKHPRRALSEIMHHERY